jgi:peptide/nickel transport system permease protein
VSQLNQPGVIELGPPSPEGSPAVAADLGRSPWEIAWTRFKRDRVGVWSGYVVLFFVAVAILAPLIVKVYGKDAYTTYGQDKPGLLNEYGFPIGPRGGMSSEHWFGLEPGLGRDVFAQLVYGARTSLLIALLTAVLATLIGVTFGLTIGYLGGRVDAIGGRIMDVALAFPSLLFLIAFTPVLESLFVSPEESTPTWVRFAILVLVLSALGWVLQARLIRGQVLSLREREFVDAARMAGAGPWRIIRRELLPNLWSPILVTFSLILPALITTEAALSFLGVGMTEPTPDWGRMIKRGAEVYKIDFTYMLFPGLALFALVLCFNLLGDAVRDALDPRSLR